MTSITQVSQIMRQVLNEQANHIARDCGFLQRERVLSGASFVQGLVFGFMGNPNASLSELSQSFANVGTPISRQGIHQRFTPQAASYLEHMVRASLAQVVQAGEAELAILRRFAQVYVCDSSQIELPASLSEVWTGCGGFAAGSSSAALKISVKWELLSGGLCSVGLHHGKTHDGRTEIQQEPMPKGSLRIADLGFFKLSVLSTIDQNGSYWLTRYKTGTTLLDREGAALRLDALLPQQVGCRIDQQVLLGQTAQIPCRLIAERVPEPVAEQRRERLLETARRRQEAVREAAWDLADWTLYLTNATPDLLDAQACLMLGRYRWQIELLFKLWKSGLQLAQSRSDHPWRILCEIYAKLIAVIVQHWLLLVGCWQQPDRSLWQASVSVQRYAWAIAAFLQRPGLLTALLQQLRQSMIPCRIESYRSRPASAQRLADLVA